jgi:hypothetical protein
MNFKMVMKDLLYLLLMVNILISQTQGDIHVADLMEFKTAEDIIIELQSDFSEYDIPLEIHFDVSLYRVEYHTIDVHNNPTIATGVIAIPFAPNHGRPLLSFQHGTVLKRTSVASVNGFDIVSMWLGGRGFISAIPDFLGLGISEMFHPYMVSNPSATAVVDIIRACRNLCDSLGILISDQLFLTGYSEGGYVTMATHKYIEENLYDEFQMTASAPCAGPYDLSTVMYNLMLTVEPYGSPNYLPYTILSYNDTYYLYESPSDFFIAPYDTLLPQLFDGTHSAGEVDAVMPEIPIQIVRQDILDEVTYNSNHPLRIALQNNDVYSWTPQSPMTLLHSIEDELVPVQNTWNAYDYFTNHGAENVDIFVDNLGSHTEAASVILLAAAAWIESFVAQTQFMSVTQGWNMIGLSVYTDENSDGELFPNSVENSLFRYTNGTYNEATHLNLGSGYWIYLESEELISISGQVIQNLFVQVQEGWNLISGPSSQVSVSALGNNLIVEGSIFGYDDYYYEPETLDPGKAYWFRSNGNGNITISVD